MRLIGVDLTRARRRRDIAEVRHGSVHARVEHAGVVHAHRARHVVDALVPSVFDHVMRRRLFHRHDRVVMMLMKVRDVRSVLLVLLSCFRVVLLLLAFPLPFHANGDGDAAHGDERHRDGENRDERNLTATEIVASTTNLSFLIARR